MAGLYSCYRYWNESVGLMRKLIVRSLNLSLKVSLSLQLSLIPNSGKAGVGLVLLVVKVGS